MSSSDFKRRYKNKLKIFLKKIFNRGYYPQIEYKCKTIYLGSDYGGWEVAEDFVNGSSVIYSFGVGEDVSFDLSLIKMYGGKVYAFDPTPRSVDWVKKQNFESNFIFFPYGIADFDGNAPFHPPKDSSFVSFKMSNIIDKSNVSYHFPVKRLSTIIKNNCHDRIDLLKMDVEGAEYDVIEDMKKSDIRPGQILVEFHHRWPEIGLKKTQQAIRTLSEMGYKLFYTSARDEFGFLLIP